MWHTAASVPSLFVFYCFYILTLELELELKWHILSAIILASVLWPFPCFISDNMAIYSLRLVSSYKVQL